MGIFNKNIGGERCEVDDQGVHHCQIFDVTKEGKTSSGTDFSFSVTKENNCEPIMMGSHDILDKDKEKVSGIIEQRVRACRKGLG